MNTTNSELWNLIAVFMIFQALANLCLIAGLVAIHKKISQ